MQKAYSNEIFFISLSIAFCYTRIMALFLFGYTTPQWLGFFQCWTLQKWVELEIKFSFNKNKKDTNSL